MNPIHWGLSIKLKVATRKLTSQGLECFKEAIEVIYELIALHRDREPDIPYINLIKGTRHKRWLRLLS